ncbi:hypothetical protein OHC33_008586 [Knufia fluminis]|uniref:Uncharacterized protein n=2 Tax=Knufia TaxID=430999 RepID=A0AAN8EGN5_9EURO|nr:hypothetical protein OHC33_008586 [Knufia fluminis]
MSDRLPGLQRRAGRRRSTPASPSSPIFQRKYGRSQDLPTFSPIEPASANTPADSPSIDLTLPSPTFDLGSFSPSIASEDHAPLRPQPVNRASDDLSKSRPRFLADTMRPATSSTGEGIVYTSQKRDTNSPAVGATRDSPLLDGHRASGDGTRQSLHREQDDGSLQRAATFWAQYDRNVNEDAAASRNVLSNKKSRFNLLNPMTLLARRRSSHNTNKLEDVSMNVSTLHVPAIPDNITPSIRGTMVHDFSAPRNRRSNIENSPRPGPAPSPNYPRRPSDMTSPPFDSSNGTPASLHSPMFKEHFQEEKRPLQPASTAYLHTQNLQMPTGGSLPSFAKNLPLNLPENSHVGSKSSNDPKDHTSDTASAHSEVTVPSEPVQPPPPPPQKTPSPVLEVPVANTIPKHMTSTSSRFSFIGQQGSIAQEKVLEDKHKQHASKDPAPVRLSVASIDDMDDYDDYDGLDDDDGFDNDEITIRNIDQPSSREPAHQGSSSDVLEGCDFEDDDEFGTGNINIKNIDMPTSQMRYEGFENDFDTDDVDIRNINVPTNRGPDLGIGSRNTNRHSLQAFHFTPQSLTLSPSAAQHTSQSTPRDVQGLPIGMAEFEEAAAPDTHAALRDSSEQSSEALFHGLGISTETPDPAASDHPSRTQIFDDSDLYFDDGEFDDDVVESTVKFDEDDLDDANQIKDIPAENARKYEEAMQQRISGDKIKIATRHETGASHDLPLFMRAESPETSFDKSATNSQAGLTENNLAAHHDALTMALNKAAANSGADRTVSFSQLSDDETDSPFHASMPGVSSRGSRYSNNLVSSGISDDDDGYGLEDDMDDEAMIAAANAEALENDDDGFYGQEFGFYARAHGRESADCVNGGYFTSRGSNGVKRSHSGKNNFQEPSLTPITERSEWSTRNSVASLPLHAGFSSNGQPLPSPGIAQLLERDSPLAEDEMSLSTLMKLRGKAFGGSSSSINSLTERHHTHSSPLAHVSGYNNFKGDGSIHRMSSPTLGLGAPSIAESEDEDEDHGRQTLTQNTPHKKIAEPARDLSQSSREQEVPNSPISRKGNHSRNSSGAESVSYAMETDGRWVLERRRTGDDGQLEVIDREYLAGTRI